VAHASLLLMHRAQGTVFDMFAQGGPGAGWMGASPLETLITRACEPSLLEPNYPLQLEIAEYVNTKKANTYVVLDVRDRVQHIY
jgi:hypothetical protein